MEFASNLVDIPDAQAENQKRIAKMAQAEFSRIGGEAVRHGDATSRNYKTQGQRFAAAVSQAYKYLVDRGVESERPLLSESRKRDLESAVARSSLAAV